jgi:hypothetical protein
MTARRLALGLVSDAFERATADLAVAGLFLEELPLRGGAGRIDWRLCGLVSELLAGGRIHGHRDEALLMPSEGRMRAPRVMLVGLGRREDYRSPQLAESIRSVMLRAVGLGVGSLALPPLGIAPDDFPRCAEAFLRGFLDGCGASARPIQLQLILPEEQHSLALRALQEASRALNHPELRFSNIGRPTPHASSTPRGHAAST